MPPINPYLNAIDSDLPQMVDLLQSWANINSGSDNLAGLANMLTSIKAAFSPLQGTIHTLSIPPRTKIDSHGNVLDIPNGQAFHMTKHMKAPIKVLLAGHMDTVFGLESPFQHCERLDQNTLRGPGVADMKGGLIVMLKALETLEKSPFAGKIGWEVLITPDEETGSSGSAPFYVEAAKRNNIGLVFEPALPDGALVSSRKGSANFAVVAKGRAAHVGRDFHVGRNAISSLVRFIVETETLNDSEKGITLNIGHIEGGGPVNIVPDLAICRFNVRINDPKDLLMVRKKLNDAVAIGNSHDGIQLTLHEITSREPKIFDKKHKSLFDALNRCATDLGTPLQYRPSGGVCDGNILSAAGLPTIDTLGVVGGNIHTVNEYMLINSLTERAKLVAYFLMTRTMDEQAPYRRHP